jgi:putative transposase
MTGGGFTPLTSFAHGIRSSHRSKVTRSQMAKFVLGAGWGMLKTQLQYKGQQVGRCVLNVSEQYTSRACSACGALTGLAGVTGCV